MSKIVPLNDMLFVFDSWTLILDIDLCAEMAVGDEVDLLDEEKNWIGRARLERILPSRNPNLRAIAINVSQGARDQKAVKFVAVGNR